MQSAYYYERRTYKLDEFDSLGALSDYRRAELLNYLKKNYLIPLHYFYLNLQNTIPQFIIIMRY